MIRNLLLTGGPGPDHDFAALADAIVGALREDSRVGTGSSDAGGEVIDTTIVTDPRQAFAMLRAAHSNSDGFDLLTVNALRWQMGADRYASQRKKHAYSLGERDLDAVDALLARGGGLLAIHTAVICFDADPRWQRLLGASWDWERSSHPPMSAVKVSATPEAGTHAITRDVGSFVVDDEVYMDLAMEAETVALLSASASTQDARASSPQLRASPVFWARQYGGGRVVTDLLGHNAASITNRHHSRLLRDSALWAARGSCANASDLKVVSERS